MVLFPMYTRQEVKKMAGYFQLFSACTLMFAAQVSGLSLLFSEYAIIIGNTGTLTMSCSINEPDVETVFRIQISRATSLNQPYTELLADIDILKNPTPTLNPELNNDKGFVAGGYLDTDNPSNTVLTLNMDIEKLTCSDAREYLCSLIYLKSVGGSEIAIARANGTFSTYVYPSITSLQGKKNEEFIEGSLSSSPAPFEVGDQLHLTCTANIGSYDTTLIRWRKSSEMGSQDEFIEYVPQEGTHTVGYPSLAAGGCSYTRTATVTYNTTTADANRDNHLAFECYVSVSGGPYGQGYLTTNNPRFYADVTGEQAPDQGGVTAAEHTETTPTTERVTLVTSSTVDPSATTLYVKSSTGKLSSETSIFQYIIAVVCVGLCSV